MAPGAPTQSSDIYDDLLPRDEDLLYEEELLRNPYSLRMWWRYLEARKDAPTKRRYLIFERALAALPGSYKVPGLNVGYWSCRGTTSAHRPTPPTVVVCLFARAHAGSARSIHQQPSTRCPRQHI